MAQPKDSLNSSNGLSSRNNTLCRHAIEAKHLRWRLDSVNNIRQELLTSVVSLPGFLPSANCWTNSRFLRYER
jgi:hypothetical protein